METADAAGGRRNRDPYAEVGRAMRDAIDKATEHDLADGDWRVLVAVLAEVSSYSRLEDRVFVEAIASRAGLTPRWTRDRLAHLAELGILVVDLRKGGSGSRPRSTVGLPQPEPLALPFEDESQEEPLALPVDEVSTGTTDALNRNARASGNREDRSEKNQPAEKDRLAGLERYTADHLWRYPPSDREDELRHRAERLGIDLDPDDIQRLLALADQPDDEPEPLLRPRLDTIEPRLRDIDEDEPLLARAHAREGA
jgi:hypothetical protein